MNSKRKRYNSLLPALVFIAAAFTVLLLVIIIGFVLLMILMVFVVFNDIRKLFF